MGMEAALGEQAAGDHGAQQQREKMRQQQIAQARNDEPYEQAQDHEQQHEHDTVRALLDG